jgi:TctA family transporter
MVMGLLMASLLAQGSPLKSIGMVLLGLLFGCVGIDINSGLARYTFGSNALLEGISFSALAMGVFAVSEVIRNLQDPADRNLLTQPVGRLMISLSELRQSWKAVLRGTGIGGAFGILPGVGPVVASFAAYLVEKRVSRDPSRFGKGAIEGVAGPEAANNMAAQTSFIPTLTLGLPGSATMAVLMGAMIIQGITPGPQVMTNHPDLFWGLIVSMWIGNVLLVILNLPLIPLWVRLLTVPPRWLWPGIILVCCIGTFSVSNSSFDVLIMVVFGLLGFLFVKLDCEPAPLLLGFVLGPMMEEHLRRSLLLSRGDPSIFLTRPISLLLLLITFAIMANMLLTGYRRSGQVKQ